MTLLLKLQKKLLQALGPARFLTDPASLESYAWDNTGVRARPDGVALVRTESEVATVLRLCHQTGTPVVPRGAGSGNVGGALAVRGGIVLSTQQMTRILEINPQDRLAVVEPGVVNGDLQKALVPHGLFWPPAPSSARICTIGGNLAMSAAGPNAVRFGTTREWVLGLSAVLPDGTPFHTGVRTTKGVVGYDLTRLLIGSEGTLAVVTGAILKLTAKPTSQQLLQVTFQDTESAAHAVSGLTRLPEIPSAIEFLDAAALGLLRDQSDLAIHKSGRAMLLLELSDNAGEVLSLLNRFKPLEIVHARDEGVKKEIWRLRDALSPALKKLAPRRINEDVVVPVSRLSELIASLERLSRESGLAIVSFGHAGNGNLHVNLLFDPDDREQSGAVEETVEHLFQTVLKLGGTLSGEHGVGIRKQPYIGWELDQPSMMLQQQIKAVFDPQSILNPGKFFPETK